MAMNLILFGLSYPILFIMYAVMKGLVKPKENIILGVTIPWTRMQEKRVLEILKSYKKELKNQCMVMAVLGLPCFLVRDFAMIYLLYIVWILAAVVVPSLVYIKWNRELMRWKKEQLWARAMKEEDITTADLKGAAEYTGVLKGYTMYPALVIGLVPVFYEVLHYVPKVSPPRLFTLGIMWLMLPLIVWAARYIDRGKCSVISSDSRLNVSYTREKKKCWSVFFQVLLWSSAVYLCCMEAALATDQSLGFLIGSIIYCAVLVIPVIWIAGRFRKINDRYGRQAVETGADIKKDDDSHWIWGMFYYNKNDSHWMVEERAGIGTTLNLAKKSSQIVMLLCVLCLLMLPVSCVWIFLEEYVPLKLSVEGDTLVAQQWKNDYEIPVYRLKSVELGELPEVRTKLNGSSIDDMKKGVYRVDEYGVCELFLKTGQEKYLILSDEDGTTYILSGETEEETEKVYEEIEKKLPDQ